MNLDDLDCLFSSSLWFPSSKTYFLKILNLMFNPLKKVTSEKNEPVKTYYSNITKLKKKTGFIEVSSQWF